MPEKKSEKPKTAVKKPVVKKAVPKTTAVTVKAAPVKKTEVKAKPNKPSEPVVVKTKTAPVEKSEAKVEVIKPPVVLEEKKPIAASVKAAEKTESKKTVKGKVLNITLLKSGIGYSKRHKATLKALGFHRLHQTIQQVDSPSLRGMLAKVDHLVRIEEQVTK
jgi:large subunit ribosomal protein L30